MIDQGRKGPLEMFSIIKYQQQQNRIKSYLYGYIKMAIKKFLEGIWYIQFLQHENPWSGRNAIYTKEQQKVADNVSSFPHDYVLTVWFCKML